MYRVKQAIFFLRGNFDLVSPCNFLEDFFIAAINLIALMQ